MVKSIVREMSIGGENCEGSIIPFRSCISRFSRGTVGIRGMSERAKELGGHLLVARAHPGTIVEVTIPVPALVSSSSKMREEKISILETSTGPVIGQASVG